MALADHQQGGLDRRTAADCEQGQKEQPDHLRISDTSTQTILAAV